MRRRRGVPIDNSESFLPDQVFSVFSSFKDSGNNSIYKHISSAHSRKLSAVANSLTPSTAVFP